MNYHNLNLTFKVCKPYSSLIIIQEYVTIVFNQSPIVIPKSDWQKHFIYEKYCEEEALYKISVDSAFKNIIYLRKN